MPKPAPTLFFLSLSLTWACSHTPQPVTSAPPSSTPTAPESTQQPTPAAPAADPTLPGREGKVVVVDPGDDSVNHPKSLVEAAREERERRSHAGEPVAVITNKSLPHSKGQLTYAQPKAKSEKAGGKIARKEKVNKEAHDEAYWRKRGLEIRQRWRLAADEIHQLEQEVADWRRRFYSESDPVVRDAQVKPEWDRALDRLQHKKTEVEATQREVEAFLEEGRQGGALPGWLREGADLEPTLLPPSPAPTDAIEPPQLQEGPP